MPKTNLTDEEKQRIIEAINDNSEPPPELMPRLFPHTETIMITKPKIEHILFATDLSQNAERAFAYAAPVWPVWPRPTVHG